MKRLAGVALLLFPLIVLASDPAQAPTSANLYRPLSEAEFKAFDQEYWQVSKCQNDYFDSNPDAYSKAKAFLAAPEKSGEFLADARRALGRATVATLSRPDLTDAERVTVAIQGLAIEGMHSDRLPAENMRAFGVMRKYFAQGMAPNCQPSDDFQMKLKRMLDAKF